MELRELNSDVQRLQAPGAERGEELVSALFDAMQKTAQAETRRVDRMKLPDSAEKANRRQTYLDRRSREEWQQRSLAFLERRQELARRLTMDALYSVLMMQHLLDLDVENLRLPAKLRRSEDTYDQDGVNHQFLLDAARSRYVVAGEVFDYSKARDVEKQPTFTARLVAAIRSTAPSSLVPHVTTAMSQSGCAALERASLRGCAVAGGSQKVEYTLAPSGEHGSGAVVTLEVRKQGFREYQTASGSDESFECDSGSSIIRKAKVFFSSNGIVDVIDFNEDIEFFQDGILVPHDALLDLPDSLMSSRSGHNSVCEAAVACAWSCLRCLCSFQESFRDRRTPTFSEAGAE
jgi:hypothetical protein